MGTTIAALVLGVVVSLVASMLAVREFRFRKRVVRTHGIIRKRKVTLMRDEGATTELVTITVDFEDAAGVKRQATRMVTSRTRSILRRGAVEHFGPTEIGDSVPILYDPDRPEDIRIDTGKNPWPMVLVLGLFGAGFIAVALARWIAAVP